MTNDEKERSSEDDHLKKMNTSSSEHNDIEQGKFFNLDTPLSLPLLVTWCGYTLL
uniref:CTNNB1 binding N-teminal domain-containing protein n=1 Tax=Ascaris lumbricoides TaxID=6252 RepID=A0A0M3IEA3_ASCLU